MTNEELNTALYKKMFAEQEKFENWLLSQSPREILKHSYEYTMREDILLSLEYNDLTDSQAAALLASPTPLDDLYHQYEKMETSHMEEVWACFESRAEQVKAMQTEAKEPVYQHSAVYAKEHGELEQYRASNRVNLQCKEAIEAAVREHFDGMYRYSPRNKEWAKSIPNYNSDTVRGGYAVNSHPAVLNGFINLVRKEQQRRTHNEKEHTPKNSVREKLKQETLAHKPAANKGREMER